MLGREFGGELSFDSLKMCEADLLSKLVEMLKSLTSGQNQRTTNNSQAYQAGRDVTVNNQLSSDQMMELMVAMAAHLSAYTNEAQQVFEERLERFRGELLNRFSEGRDEVRSEAFGDPDFQFALKDAQEAFARSGEEELGHILIETIAERSKEVDRGRLALTLNSALIAAPKLTSDEFSVLALILLVRTRPFNPQDLKQLCDCINAQLMPLIDDRDFLNQSIFLHLQALSCATLSIGEYKIATAFKRNYAGLLSRGFLPSDLESLGFGDLNLTKILMPCLHDPNKLQFCALDRSTFDILVANEGIDASLGERLWGMFESTLFPDAELPALLSPHVHNIEQLFLIWDNSQLKNMNISLLGLAIGHAYARRKVHLSLPLSVYIS